MKEIGIEGEGRPSLEEDAALLAMEMDQWNQKLMQTVARLQTHRTPRLPADTRFKSIKEILLRVIKVYSRYQDLYNSSNIEAIRTLNKRVELLQRQVDLQQRILDRLRQESRRD